MRSLNPGIMAASLLACSIAGCGQSTLTGEWRGTENNLPWIDLTIHQDAGHTSGTATFYLIKRNSPGSDPYVDGHAGGAMEHVKFEPEKLSFDMHRPDGSLVSFRMELADAGHARLFRTSEDSGQGSGFPLVRVDP